MLTNFFLNKKYIKILHLVLECNFYGVSCLTVKKTKAHVSFQILHNFFFFRFAFSSLANLRMTLGYMQ